ncbi:hypothetical protein [Nitrosomonas sp. Nm58]|uniref:hypothetical protein n=1 Tax=Nitrosomonas sp. Nm58 TaxID=200126 RepID=UPI000B8389A9|nr:hypothetical protein [Nitrosomonas sp. Nm58]
MPERRLRDLSEDSQTIDEVLGWVKTVGGMRKLKLVGRKKISGQLRFVAAIYDLVRIGSLTGG